MREIFDRYRKAIITGGGVVVFLLAGLLTMLVTDSGNEPGIRVNDKPSQPSQNQPSSPKPPAQESPKTSRTIYAYITGEVKNPGVYKLSDDARIFQLADMAGGFTSNADTESLNLADIVADGAHVHIGAKSQATGQSPTIPGLPAGYSARQVAVPPLSGRVNINTATATELESLPGIGPAIAKRIIDYRQSHGNFARPEDIVNVRGISQSKLAQILPHITAMNAGSSVTQSQSSAGKINVNTATATELESLPGIGPAIAKRIINYRQSHGNFARPEDLVNVSGIGQSKLAQILPHITAMNVGSSVTLPQSSSEKIDINRATAKQLEALPGVGSATAQRIIDYRNANGRFNSPEDLVNVRGISWSKLEKMKALIVIR